eukprot:scaffold223399_cov21-Prasinocladus_malaysianus.AAC.1
MEYFQTSNILNTYDYRRDPMNIMFAVREAKDDGSIEGIFDSRPGVKTWNVSAGKELLELALRCTRHKLTTRFVHPSSVNNKRHCACCTAAR